VSDENQHRRDASNAATPDVVELSDDDLRGLLELPTELFGVFDPLSATAWCSPAVAEVLGYRPEELEHVDLESLVHPDDLGSPTDDVEDFPRGGDPRTLDVRCRCRDGSWRWLEWSGSWDAARGLLYGAARDVTARHVARETARANDRLVQAILDHSSAAISVQDSEGRFVLVNDAFLEVFGVARPEVLDHTRAEIWGDGTSEDDVERSVLHSGRSVVRDDFVETAQGLRTLMTVRFPLRDGDDAVIGVASIATDVSERTDAERVLAERERVLDTILRACPDIVTLLDRDGRVREISQAAARILGYHIDDVVRADSRVSDDSGALVHPDDFERVRGDYRRMLSSEKAQLDLRYRVRHGGGHWVTLDTRGQCIVGEDGQVAGAVVVSRDVTADLAFEEELEEALSVAELASTAKSEFLSRMSHELRTPLNSVLGFAQLLGLDELDAQQQEAVGHIITAGHHLLGLIDEVLDIARIESGRLELSLDPTPVLEVVMDAVDIARPLAEDRQVTIDVDTGDGLAGAHVRADRQRLLQVLLNLLSNGVKYNCAGGTVSVEVRRRHHRTELVVRDTGPGIDAADLHRVFAPFDRLGAERSGIEGTGVGLTLTKQLVEEMGGAIALSSAPGEGATFTVSLRNAPPPSASDRIARPAPPCRPVEGGLHVLHIEDNHANLELVEQVLSRAGGVDLYAAMSGSLGLELAAERRPDLVLLDLHLPDMPGTEVLDCLRGDPATADVPVVVVSADATPTTVRQLRASGVLAYLTKPIDVQELLRVVELVAAGEGPE
jgi:PAS domain S-box-containing protein